MSLDLVPTGRDVPDDVNVIIEIPKDADPIKYEVDKATGAIFVDRVLTTPMRTRATTVYIPHTLSGDGDPVVVLVVMPLPLIPGSVIRVRPIGMLAMRDEAGEDQKVIAEPVDKVFPAYAGVKGPADLRDWTREKIAHFFEHYKDLEKGKWVTIVRWVGRERAGRMIGDGIRRAAQAGDEVAARHLTRPTSRAVGPRRTRRPAR